MPALPRAIRSTEGMLEQEKKCGYCSVVENTILRFPIPNDGGHHRALCNIPNSGGKVRERVQEIKRQLSNH
ncbi:hypothetical protein Aduo_001933 [Ancylostoma duodenale]